MSGFAVLGAGIAATSAALGLWQKNRMDKKRYEKQLNDERANWNMQNAYNSPSAQMARLKSAGLNPNLVYQQGGALSGSGEMTTPNYPEAPLMDYQNIGQMALQFDSTEAAIDKIEAEKELITQQSIDKALRNKWLEPYLKSELFNLNANSMLLQEQRNLVSAQSGLTKAQIQTEAMKFSEIQQQIEVLKSQKKLNDKSAEQLNHVIKQIDANTDLITKEAQKAVLAIWFEKLRQSANSNPRSNVYTLELQQLREQIDSLQFDNSYFRRAKDVPLFERPDYHKQYERFKRTDNPYDKAHFWFNQ